MTASEYLNIGLLDPTGERFLPEMAGDIATEHLHRYQLALELVKGLDVLDIASGEGYGSALLSENALSVVGVDLSPEAIRHALTRYKRHNLHFRQGSCSAIPLEAGSVDVVVSFETLEHHDEHELMMLEIKRVLRPNGLLIISCPDKLEYSDKPHYHNPFHVRELYQDEFFNLMKLNFKFSDFYGQRLVYGSLIFGETETPTKNFEKNGEGIATSGKILASATYLIALASDAPLPRPVTGIFTQPVETSEAVTNRLREIAILQRDLRSANGEITRVKSTFSWKITKPLRYIWNKFRV